MHNCQGLTEFVLEREHPEQIQLLLPVVAHLSQTSEARWITWVSDRGFNRKLLKRAGINSAKLRLIQANSSSDTHWITREALVAGNSQTVIADTEGISEIERSQLSLAAKQGACQVILLRRH